MNVFFPLRLLPRDRTNSHEEVSSFCYQIPPATSWHFSAVYLLCHLAATLKCWFPSVICDTGKVAEEVTFAGSCGVHFQLTGFQVSQKDSGEPKWRFIPLCLGRVPICTPLSRRFKLKMWLSLAQCPFILKL